MKVSELANEFCTTSEFILTTLKSMRLKAKDSEQELSSAVVSVVKSQLGNLEKENKVPKVPGAKKPPVVAKKAVKSETVKKKAVKKKTATTKKVTTKKAVTKKAKSEEKTGTATKAVKKTTKKAVKKVVAKTEEPVSKKVIPVKAGDVRRQPESKEAERKTPDKTATDKRTSKETPRGKPKISDAPVITLKPLARKRRRGPEGGRSRSDQSSRDGAAGVRGQSSEEAPSVLQQELTRDASLPDIEIRVPITVKEFSVKIQEKPSTVLKRLMQMGVFAHINQSLEADVVQHLTRHFGFNLAKIKTQEEQLVETHKPEEDKSLLVTRAPVITFMGHVDHGKTSLLDKIRKSKVADVEHGGITQHIGAYSVQLEKGAITFLDTPGHEAFTAMRARGAHITDLVVLVVAADEGVMPQTEEAIDHARAADVPIVVALNKIDREGANLDKVKKQLAERNLASEDWGGKTVMIGVSAMTGEGVDQLLEMILLESELLELSANPNKPATGIVVEAHLSQGKGVLATLIVQGGTLREGDFVVAGPYYGKVKALFDDHERPIKEAGPSMAVEVLGMSSVPEAGEIFYVVEDERQAREITLRRSQDVKNKKLNAGQKVTLEDLYTKIQDGEIKELNVIIKSDVQGSLEALRDSLAKIPSDRVKLRFIHSSVGDVNTSDVLLAAASKAIIIAFHVGVGPKAAKELERVDVDVREYRIIYDAVDDLRNALEGMLEKKVKRHFQARAEVRQVFNLTKHGKVAGCYLQKGKMMRKVHADVLRDGEVVFSGVVTTLKRFKDDVKEVTEGMECGISFDQFTDYQVGDLIESYILEEIAQTL